MLVIYIEMSFFKWATCQNLSRQISFHMSQTLKKLKNYLDVYNTLKIKEENLENEACLVLNIDKSCYSNPHIIWYGDHVAKEFSCGR